LQIPWTVKYKRTIATALIAIIILGATSIYYTISSPPKRPEAIFHYTETIIIDNKGNMTIDFGNLVTEAFLNLDWQKAHLININKRYNISKDGDGNPILIIEGPETLSPGESYNVSIIWEIESYSRFIPDVSVEGSGDINDIPSDLIANYTRDVPPWRSPPNIRLNTSNWEGTPYYNMSLQELASTLMGNKMNVLEILLEDVKWITDHISYPSTPSSPKYPIETARRCEGDCDDQSNLLIALLRLQGIPAFLMMGQVYLSRYANLTGTGMDGHLFYEGHYTMGHAWAMVYVPPWGWLPCDPVMAMKGYPPKRAIDDALVRYPITIVFRNVTGIGGAEASDYIGSSRNETERAKREGVYFKLIMEMKQLIMPIYEFILRSPIFVLYAEAICLTALIIIVGAHDRRRTLQPYLRKIYCPYCGMENPYEAIYCGWCGRRIHRRGEG